MMEHTSPAPLMIGRVASLYNITVQTLRHYDKIGLFRPEITNPDTGYRYYSFLQLRELEYILFLRRLDFSLPEIQAAMDEMAQGAELGDILRKRDAALEAKIAELQALRSTIAGLSRIEQQDVHPLNQIWLREQDCPRNFLVRDIAPLDVHKDDFIPKLMDERRLLLGTIPTIQTEYNFGALVSRHHYTESGALCYTGILLDPGFYHTLPTPDCREFPAGYYATITFDRNLTQPEDAYQKLTGFVSSHQFETDDTILELGIDPSFSSISRLSRLTQLEIRLILS